MRRFRWRRLLQGGLLGAAAGVFAPFGGAFGKAPGRAAAGISEPTWRFAEHRGAARLAADSAHARRQVAALSSPEGRERAGRILDRLRARQDAAPARWALPFDRRPVAGSDAEILVVSGAAGTIVPLGHVVKGDDHPVATEPPVLVPLGHTVKGDDHPVVTEAPVIAP